MRLPKFNITWKLFIPGFLLLALLLSPYKFSFSERFILGSLVIFILGIILYIDRRR